MSVIRSLWSLTTFLLSLPFLAGTFTTWQEYVAAAKAAIGAGNLDEAEVLTKQAQALKAVSALEEPPTPEPALAAKAEPVRLPFAAEPTQASDTQNAAIKTWAVKRYGEIPAAAEQIAAELYGQHYSAVAWAKSADFRRYLRSGHADPRLASLVLLTPTQIMDAAASGLMVGEMKTTMIEASDTLGGYLVPEDFRAEIIERLPGLTVVRPLANVISTSRDRVSLPKATGGTSRYTGAVRVTWVDESPSGASASATNAAWGQVAIPVHTVMANTPLSRNLIEDAAFDLDAYLRRQFATAMAIDEDEQFLVGSGAGRPQGVLNGTAASGAPHDSDVNTNTVNSGHASTLTGDGIVAVPYGLPAQYRQNGAVWVMAKDTVKATRTLKDSQNRYLWSDNNNNLAAGQPERLQGYPVKESEAMPAVAANKYPIIFGDFMGYTIADRIGMSVERYLDSGTAGTNSVIFYARRRLGGQVSEGYRLVVQKVSA